MNTDSNNLNTDSDNLNTDSNPAVAPTMVQTVHYDSFVVSLGTVPAQNGTVTYTFSIGNRTGIDKIASK